MVFSTRIRGSRLFRTCGQVISDIHRDIVVIIIAPYLGSTHFVASYYLDFDRHKSGG